MRFFSDLGCLCSQCFLCLDWMESPWVWEVSAIIFFKFSMPLEWNFSLCPRILDLFSWCLMYLGSSHCPSSLILSPSSICCPFPDHSTGKTYFNFLVFHFGFLFQNPHPFIPLLNSSLMSRIETVLFHSAVVSSENSLRGLCLLWFSWTILCLFFCGRFVCLSGFNSLTGGHHCELVTLEELCCSGFYVSCVFTSELAHIDLGGCLNLIFKKKYIFTYFFEMRLILFKETFALLRRD